MMSEIVLKLLQTISAVPHRWLVVLGNILGDVLYWLAAPRRRIARTAVLGPAARLNGRGTDLQHSSPV